MRDARCEVRGVEVPEMEVADEVGEDLRKDRLVRSVGSGLGWGGATKVRLQQRFREDVVNPPK
jgi:hypothetical protein